MTIENFLKEKLLNPHCPHFKTCKRNTNNECLFCIHCIKGTEAYLEKLGKYRRSILVI